MKVAIITDQHFGARKSSKILHDYYGRFYQDVFFPYLKENNIKTLIDMGDTFDNRRTIDLWAIDWARNNYYDILHDMGFIPWLEIIQHIIRIQMRSIPLTYY